MSDDIQDNIPREETALVIRDRRYAGFWMRFWAYITDLLVVFSVNGILLSPLHFVNEGQPLDIGFWTLTGILGSIVFYVYFLLMTKFFGQTLGKMLFGLRVIREDDGSLTWSDLLFREVVGRFIHRVLFLTPLLYVVVAFTNQKQGLHDMFASTRVVHTE
ncbi:RDD family protein [Virgibacillus senegalensis]|uniref:RDD family protein n=1 Tax=Virgibacillus senegalensis TaxID=1499679 RepID=UPI00069E3028|nr:RDD family protein [Virgibacillus senegalensis]